MDPVTIEVYRNLSQAGNVVCFVVEGRINTPGYVSAFKDVAQTREKGNCHSEMLVNCDLGV